MTEKNTTEVDALIEQAHRINRYLTRGGIIFLLLIGTLLVGFNFFAPWSPRPASAAVTPGRVDVCVTKSDTPKSWTKGLEKKANKAFDQRVNVKRVGEDSFGGCEIVVWTEGRVALDYVTGEPSSNPRYHVYIGPYAMADAEINLGSVTPKKQRPATLVRALREAGVR